MALRPSRPKRVEITTFDPVLFSIPENEFLLEQLGQPPVVAMRVVPPAVNPRAVRPIIDRVYELEQLKQHEGLTWVGIAALKEKIKVYLAENAKWKLMAQRNRKAPRFPSMFSFDNRGRAHRGGVGSDSTRVKTYFDSQGNRIPFEIDLLPDNVAPWVAPGFTEQSADKRLVEDGEKNRIECFCGHTESFKQESRASRAAARARMSKHLRKATEFVDDHREVYTNEFGG